MDQNKKGLSLGEVMLILGFSISLLIGLLAGFIGVITFFTVHKWFGFITFIGGLLLFPSVQNVLKIKLKLGMEDLFLNLVAILLILFGGVSLVEEKKDRDLRGLEVEISQQQIDAEIESNLPNQITREQNVLHSIVYDIRDKNEEEATQNASNEIEVVNSDLACRNKLDITKFVELLRVQDDQAYTELAYQSLKNGDCVAIKKGDIVSLRNTDMLIGMVQIQKQDSTDEYWTLYGNINSENIIM
ncbi:hypothetical protein LF296_03100 [Acinetobacter vivianii]|uniref:Uncharacterized protein n=1 Tax=Acinetobacter vivianii TaxID=1776742 RepID=A0AAJ6NK60_9GAMM|nr:hypothetical protein [Acinetobacter vivianii]WDZ51798.1 hypothetical protein LF296_03100 [Acinetobacter vivianii]